MAGAGYKLFNTGDVLTAAQVNTYLNEQTVMVFASSAARTSALSGVLAEGMMSYLQDTNAVEVYNGTSWVNVGNAGDITEVQAGVGISIASGTGPIPVITNSSTDLITTAGDLLYGTAADTVARLGIGTAGQVLKVNSGATAPEWATPAGGGKVLQVVQNTYSTQTSTQSTSFVDTGMTVTITPTLATSKVMIVISASIYLANGARTDGNAGFKLIRAATDILTLDNSFHINLATVNSGAMGGYFNYTYLDSPATTSSTIYKTQQRVDAAVSFIYTAIGSKVCTMTAYEIGV